MAKHKVGDVVVPQPRVQENGVDVLETRERRAFAAAQFNFGASSMAIGDALCPRLVNTRFALPVSFQISFHHFTSTELDLSFCFSIRRRQDSHRAFLYRFCGILVCLDICDCQTDAHLEQTSARSSHLATLIINT